MKRNWGPPLLITFTTMKKLLLFLGALSLALGDDEGISESELMARVIGPYKNDGLLNSFGNTIYDHQTNNSDDVHFFLYNNPENWKDFKEFQWNDESSVKSLSWIKGAPIKICIHGFLQSQNTSMPSVVKNAYLERMRDNKDANVNIVVVDWGRLAGRPDPGLILYPKAVHNTQIVGRRVGEMVDSLKNYGITVLRDVHIIGQSLGAHVAGWAGQTVQELNNGMSVGRITGTDPAGPGFFKNLNLLFWDKGRQLKKGDADFVDIIHTAWGTYGINENIGDVDLFPNPNFVPWIFGSFEVQPRCFLPTITKSGSLICSHNMAPIYFSMSILKDMPACKKAFWFTASAYQTLGRFFRCRTSTATFGENIPTTSSGEHFIRIPNKLKEEFEVVFDNIRGGPGAAGGGLLLGQSNNNYIGDIMKDDNEYFGLQLTPENSAEVKAIKNMRKYSNGYLVSSGKIIQAQTIQVLVPRSKKLELLMNLSVVKFSGEVQHFATAFRTSIVTPERETGNELRFRVPEDTIPNLNSY